MDSYIEDESTRQVMEERNRNALVWCWGKNKDGELSLAATKNAIIPRAAKGLKNKHIVFISSGGQHTAVVTHDHKLYICGSYLHGMEICICLYLANI